MIIDESHVTIPQLHAMYNGDRSRKEVLVEHGFRLPSALDNRPLRFEEFEERINQVIFVSATPGPYELEKAPDVVEQIIRPTGLLDPKVHVRPTRGQIDDLIGDGGEARQVDIAARLGVAQPTVAKMLKRLCEDGFVQQRPYRGVFLTEAGRRLAAQARERHRIVEQFLCALGVSPEIARRDAEGIEHHVSAKTLDAFRRHLGRGRSNRS